MSKLSAGRSITAGLIGGALLLLVALWVSETPARPEDGGGPWQVVSGGPNGGYLYNEQTGEVWRLRDNAKIAVRLADE